MLVDLPKDILRLILPLIDDPRGYHGLVCSSKLFHQLGKEIVEKKKRQFRRSRRTTDRIYTSIEEVLPNGQRDGIYQYWVHDVLLGQVTYVDGKKEGINFTWFYEFPDQLSHRNFYKQDQPQWEEEYYSNGNLRCRYQWEGGSVNKSLTEHYNKDGTPQKNNLLELGKVLLIPGIIVFVGIVFLNRKAISSMLK